MFAARVVAASLILWTAALTPCIADDAATLDSWQSSFNQVWQADSCVQEFQSWSKYWGNVHAFYFGGQGFTGWFVDSQKILPRVTDTTANATVTADLTSVGRRIGGEWAKVDGCRKVRTRSTWMAKISEPDKPALLDWEKQLMKAANADSGNGASIEATVKSINGQLDALGVAPVTS